MRDVINFGFVGGVAFESRKAGPCDCCPVRLGGRPGGHQPDRGSPGSDVRPPGPSAGQLMSVPAIHWDTRHWTFLIELS